MRRAGRKDWRKFGIPPKSKPPVDKKEEKDGAEAVIIAMMRDDPEFAREVEALAFRHIQKKMGISQK